MVDEAVLRRLIREAGGTVGPIYGRNGKGQLRKHLHAYNQAAQLSPWVVLIDLDRDDECAPPFCLTCLPGPSARMCFRVVVREIEAWLMADREKLARFLSISPARVPRNPEGIDDPKRAMVDLARHSRRREIREDLVPGPGSGRQVWPAYASRLIEFIDTHWRPEVAASKADSLFRCRQRLQELVQEGA
jgi:hypothetical protein